MTNDLTPQPDISPRTVATVAAGTPLQAGTLVYRVVEVDFPPDVYEPHTWEAVGIIVERASDKQIKLRRAFSGLARTVFEPTAFGRFFFETPQQAIQCFLIERHGEIKGLDRKRKTAERALAWAESQSALATAESQGTST
jgi:hypothetical protein